MSFEHHTTTPILQNPERILKKNPKRIPKGSAANRPPPSAPDATGTGARTVAPNSPLAASYPTSKMLTNRHQSTPSLGIFSPLLLLINTAGIFRIEGESRNPNQSFN